jgi:hypothetical protein
MKCLLTNVLETLNSSVGLRDLSLSIKYIHFQKIQINSN